MAQSLYYDTYPVLVGRDESRCGHTVVLAGARNKVPSLSDEVNNSLLPSPTESGPQSVTHALVAHRRDLEISTSIDANWSVFKVQLQHLLTPPFRLGKEIGFEDNIQMSLIVNQPEGEPSLLEI